MLVNSLDNFKHGQNILLGETEESQVGLTEERQQQIESFCNARKRIQVRTDSKLIDLRMEYVINSGMFGVVCAARKTRLMMSIGKVFAVKIVQENLDNESLTLFRLQRLPNIIRCLWECNPVRLSIPPGKYHALPMEYVEMPTLRDWLRLFSIVLPPQPINDRQNLLYSNQDIRTAYRVAKSNAIILWTSGWVHGEMHTGNILFDDLSLQIKFVNVQSAKAFEDLIDISTIRNRLHARSELIDWVDDIIIDFLKFSYSFGLAIFCPEEHLIRPTGTPEGIRNPRASPCIDFHDILPIMEHFDPELGKALDFFETSVDAKNFATLPRFLRILVSKFHPRESTDLDLIYAVQNAQSGGDFEFTESSVLLSLSPKFAEGWKLLLFLVLTFGVTIMSMKACSSVRSHPALKTNLLSHHQ